MQNNNLLKKAKPHQPILFTLFLIGGLLIFLLGSNFYTRFPTNRNPFYEWGLTLGFLVLTGVLRKSDNLKQYRSIAFAFFVASFANALNLLLGNWLADILPGRGSDLMEIAIDKLSQCIPIVLSIILLTRISGDSLDSLYIKKGKFRKAMMFGFLSFAFFSVIFVILAMTQSNTPENEGLTASGIGLTRIITYAPWILVFVLANAFMEELWFRGVFMKKLKPFLGTTAIIIVTALVFALPHFGVTYISSTERFIFPLIVFILGLINAYVILKTDSIWGSVLFHAGYDLLVIIPILASL